MNVKSKKTKKQVNSVIKQELLIVKLNQITKGWAEYHQCICAKSTFALIDHRLWEMLWKWEKRRHPRKCNKWVKTVTGIRNVEGNGLLGQTRQSCIR